MNTLRNIIVSKKFLPVVFAFFVLQAMFYAWYIGFGVPSDETYHYGSIQYYAHQPVTTGPFTHNQDPSTLPIVRNIDRDSSYLYHYLMSFPARLMNALHAGMHTQVLVLRFIDVLLAALSLYVLKKCLDEISNDALIKNFTIFAIAMTGMAVWVAGSINYDDLANLLFLLFVYVSIRLIKKPEPLKILLVITLAMTVSITKFPFLPVVLAGMLGLLIILWRKNVRPNQMLGQLGKSWQGKRMLTTLIILAFLVSGGLFTERIGLNLIRYHSVRPSCTEFFSVDECRTFNVYNRNFRQKRVYTPEAKSYLISQFDPTSYTAEWIYGMYNTLFFQLGDRRFESAAANRVFAFMLLIAISITAFMSRSRRKLSDPAVFAFFIAAAYLLILFVYNMNTYISIGQKYGAQGRYILPVLGFIYFFTITMVINTYRNRRPRTRKHFGFAWLAVLLMFFMMHFPPMLLWRYTGSDPTWRQTFVLPKEILD